jgi:hypothetical protein
LAELPVRYFAAFFVFLKAFVSLSASPICVCAPPFVSSLTLQKHYRHSDSGFDRLFGSGHPNQEPAMSSGSSYLHFDGFQSYIEVPDSPDFSLTTTAALTVSAWIRPSTLTFPSTEGQGVDLTKAYVHWLGKGGAGEEEWVFRMYSADNSVGRANRISFYVFNPDGHLGVGSHFQDPGYPVQAGVWIHVVGAADARKTYLHINGAPVDSDVYTGQITPKRGTAPVRIGTRDLKSFFQGEIREVRFWNRILSDAEIQELFNTGTAPTLGLTAEYLLTRDIAPDTARSHDGWIVAPDWIPDGS